MKPLSVQIISKYIQIAMDYFVDKENQATFDNCGKVIEMLTKGSRISKGIK